MLLTQSSDGGPGALVSTSTMAPSGTMPGIVSILSPDPYVTTTTSYDAGPNLGATIVNTISARSASGTGTILTSTPIVYATVTVQ